MHKGQLTTYNASRANKINVMYYTEKGTTYIHGTLKKTMPITSQLNHHALLIIQLLHYHSLHVDQS